MCVLIDIPIEVNKFVRGQDRKLQWTQNCIRGERGKIDRKIKLK